MNLRYLAVATLIAASGAVLNAQSDNPSVRIHTNLGDIDVILRVDAAPATVVNFINYVKKDAYTNAIFHRSVRNFVIQGGGYRLQNHAVAAIPESPSVRNEYKLSNVRGTLAMAQYGGDINSATNQFFFNLADNTSGNANLDSQRFTVFGMVANTASLAVMDKIAALPILDNGGALNQLPVIDYRTGALQDSNYVLITSIEETVALPSPAISANGVVTASAFGAFSTAAPGGYIEIYGSNLAGSSRGWATADFTGNPATHAPTSLDSVSVTINGRTAFINYVSPTQVNVQIPDSFPRAGTFPLILNYRGLTSATYSININPVQPGLLAPALFKVDGKQFVAAVHASGALVANSSIPGVPAAPAAPGETITIYGTGWGGVMDTSPIAGEINSRAARLEGAVQATIGSLAANVPYAGLSPGLVGVDQLNIVVPDDAPTGDLPLTVLFNGTAIPQTLFLSVKRN